LQARAPGSGTPVQVEAALPVAQPTYRTHLSLAKPFFRPGEDVYFRTVSLERYSLQPPPQPFTVTYTVTDAANKKVWETAGLTLNGGIGGGTFPLRNREEPDKQLAGGEDTLAMTEALGRLPEQSWPILVVKEQPSDQRPPVSAADTDLNVEYSPEGGALLAGLPNRVYFSVRTAAGRLADLEGRLLDGQ